jgi:RNase P subunit RPR2
VRLHRLVVPIALALAALLGGALAGRARLPVKDQPTPPPSPAPAPEPQADTQAPPPPANPAGTPTDIVPPARSSVLDGQGTTWVAGQFVGPGNCASANCHGNATATDTYDVLQNEFSTWFHSDPHRGAWEVLGNETSQRIARNLRLAEKPLQSQVCLTCHALAAPRKLQAVRLEPEDGISCEGCHGAAGGWLARHNEAGWSHADSVASGMLDLRSLRVRGELCLSCHQGNKAKQVDHELLAAGHPELVFELDNYSEQVSHWLPFAQKKDIGGRVDTHGVRAWAAGQVNAFRQGLLQLSRRSQSERWPEFSEMSCDKCHHDLAGGKWRQVRGYRYRAGQPAWSPARWLVLRHLVDAVAPAERAGLDADVERVAAAVSQLTPSQTVRESADNAAASLARVAARIEGASFDQGRVRGLLAALAADGQTLREADRESAEQVALTVQSLVAYLAERQPRVSKGPLGQSVNALFAELEDPDRYDRDRFVGALDQLASALR